MPQPELFEIEARSLDGGSVVIVTATGELDLATCGPLHDLLLQSEATQPGRLVLDLRGLSFIDACGLRTVLDADARARPAGRRLQVVCVRGPVTRLLGLTGVDRRLDLSGDLPADARRRSHG